MSIDKLPKLNTENALHREDLEERQVLLEWEYEIKLQTFQPQGHPGTPAQDELSVSSKVCTVSSWEPAEEASTPGAQDKNKDQFLPLPRESPPPLFLFPPVLPTKPSDGRGDLFPQKVPLGPVGVDAHLAEYFTEPFMSHTEQLRGKF